MRRYKAKRVKTRSYQEWVGHFVPRFEGDWVVPGEYVLVSTKLDAFCYLTVQTAPCYVVVLTQYRCVADGQTDRRNCRR